MKVKIPNDIKLYIALRVGARIFAFLAGLAAVMFALWFYRDTLAEYSISARVFVHIIPIVLVFVLAGMPTKLIDDKSWVGTIEEIKEESLLSLDSFVLYHDRIAYANRRINCNNIVVLIVRTNNGKKIKYIPKSYNSINYSTIMKFFLDNYKVGDVVAHIYKTDYLQIVERANIDDETDNIHCVICGEKNPTENEKCENCRHTLHVTEVQNEGENPK